MSCTQAEYAVLQRSLVVKQQHFTPSVTLLSEHLLLLLELMNVQRLQVQVLVLGFFRHTY